MVLDSGYLHMHQGYVVHVHNQCCNAPVVVMLEDLLVHVQLHLVHDFPAVGLRLTFLVPFHLHFPVWPAHISAAGFLLSVGAGFPG